MEIIETQWTAGCVVGDTGYVQTTQQIVIRTDYLARIPDGLHISPDSLARLANGYLVGSDERYRITNPWLSFFAMENFKKNIRFDGKCLGIHVLGESASAFWLLIILCLAAIVLFPAFFMYDKRLEEGLWKWITVVSMFVELNMAAGSIFLYTLEFDWRVFILPNVITAIIVGIIILKNRNKQSR